MAARFSKNCPPIDCLASHRLPPLKSEGARDEGVQYEAESAQTAEHRGISALVSSEPLLSATGPYAEVAIAARGNPPLHSSLFCLGCGVAS
jgi:hypothetical protein